MKMKLLLMCLCLITLVDGQSENICEAAATCKDCLDADGSCKWCADTDFDKSEQNKNLPRCNLKKKLLDKGCKNIQIEDEIHYPLPRPSQK